MYPIGPESFKVWYRVNWREIQARNYDLEPADTIVSRYRRVLQLKEKCDDDVILAVHLLSLKPWVRGQLEAYTMAGLAPREICERFHYGSSTVETFQKVFCDIEPLKDYAGSLFEACVDPSGGQQVSKMRMFGLRYGTLFLDWLLTKLKVLTEKQFSEIENRLRSALLLKATEIETTPLSDTERYSMLLKVIQVLSQYKAKVVDPSSANDLEYALVELKKFVVSAPAPPGISSSVLSLELATPETPRSKTSNLLHYGS